MLIAFDLDDTLYSESEFVRSGLTVLSGILASRGIPSFLDTSWKLFESGVRGKLFDRTLELLGVKPEASLITELVEIYRTHAPTIALFADARICLDRVKRHGRLALITDGPSKTQWNKIRALSLESEFDRIVVTEDLGPDATKPSLKAFELVSEAGRGDSSVYIGDNPVKDFQGPKRLGWKTIRVRRPCGLHFGAPNQADAVPDVEVPDLAGVDGWLERFKA